MDSVTFGAISSSFSIQLSKQSLSETLSKLPDAIQHHEYRSNSLGDCEALNEGLLRPNIQQLRSAAEQFPSIEANFALQVPFLSKALDNYRAEFMEGLKAAVAVSPNTPHLRIVDGSVFSEPWHRSEDIPSWISMNLKELLLLSIDSGVRLSVENYGQPIRSMELLIRSLKRNIAGGQFSNLGLCIDPANQILIYPHSDPVEEVGCIVGCPVSLVHAKQTRNGVLQETVTDGDIDYQKLLVTLARLRYQGPIVIEIPPNNCILENLSRSISFLKSKLRITMSTGPGTQTELSRGPGSAQA